MATLKTLIAAYRSDPDSSYQRLRFHVRKNHDSLLRRITDILPAQARFSLFSQREGR